MLYTHKRMRGAMQNTCFKGLDKLIKQYKVQTVLEFGSGYSSYWFAERVKYLVTVDTQVKWFPKDKVNVTCLTIKSNGKDLNKVDTMGIDYDLVLLDCYAPLRKEVFTYVRNTLQWKIFAIHDWGRDIKMYDKEYLKQFKRYDFGSLRVACKE